MDLFDGFARIVSQDLLQLVPGFEQVLRCNGHIRLLGAATRSAHGLVNHVLCIWQHEAFALSTRGCDDGSHRGSRSHDDGLHICLDKVHGIHNGQTCRDRASWCIDIEVDVLSRVLGIQEKQLSDNGVGHVVFNWACQHDDAVF